VTIADEELRAALWRAQRVELLMKRLAYLRVLTAPPGPAARVRAAWRPVELAIAEKNAPESTPDELLEEQADRRNPFGCLIP
jgi:hypothetical protein